MGIAFGWAARGRLRTAMQLGDQTALALASLVRLLRSVAPDRPVHRFGHSLGGLVAPRALCHLHPGDISSVILLNAAAFQSDAEAALTSDAGRRAELFNIVSRENDV